MSNEFDLIVIGSGPAGYTGAIRAAQLGMKVACVEKNQTLGGTCLNVGCIPSKAMLNASEKFNEANHNLKEIGIDVKPKLNLKQMLAFKNKTVSDLCKGISGLFTKNKITRFYGHATITAPNKVMVNGDKDEALVGKKILIATGSEVAHIPSVEIDEKNIVSSTGALDFPQVPKELIVIGAGYIGLELGSVWRRLGAKVTVVEFLDRIVPSLDNEIAKQFHKILEKQGINFKLSNKVLAAKNNKNNVELELEDIKQGTKSKIKADKVLVAVGRKPNSSGLGLKELGIKIDDRGCIEVNSSYETSIPNIYAVGDVIKGAMLAHKAEEEAVAAVEIMAGQAPHVNYNIIPSVVYTWPEVAAVGKTEEELKQQGVSYKIGKFPFMANSRARTINNIEGMVKILADSKTDEILGAHIIGPSAGDLIAEITLGMEFKAAAEDIARTCHAHPTLSEAVKEAALAVDKRTINM